MGVAVLIVVGFAIPVVVVLLARKYTAPAWVQRLCKNGNPGNVPTSGESIAYGGDSGGGSGE
jgi:hypothetical protein